MKRIAIILVVVLAFSGCRKTEGEAPDLGYGYFPRNLGSWIEYQVDTLYRDDAANAFYTASYRLREKVVEQYTDPAGRTAWRIHRLVLDPDSQWVVRDVWTSTFDGSGAEVTEENMRRLKLSFPVREGRRWDLNALNTEEELEVAHRQVDQPWSNAHLSFSSTVLVKNTVPPNPIVKRNHEERWAKGIGLVHLYREDTNTQYPNINGQTVVQVKGWRLEMTALDYGTD